MTTNRLQTETTQSVAEEAPDDLDMLVEGQLRRRRAIRRMRSLREELQQKDPENFNQEAVGKRMGLAHGQPTIARLESGTGDPILSTMERYAAALGGFIDMCLVDAEGHRLTEPASVPKAEDQAPIDSIRDLDAKEHPYKLPADIQITEASAPPELDDREREILRLMSKGMDTAAIAKQLLMKPNAVQEHVAGILEQVGRAGLVVPQDTHRPEPRS